MKDTTKKPQGARRDGQALMISLNGPHTEGARVTFCNAGNGQIGFVLSKADELNIIQAMERDDGSFLAMLTE